MPEKHHFSARPEIQKWLQKRLIFREYQAFWWGKVDSNHRSHWQQIYSLPPLATREFPHIHLLQVWKSGAGRRTRTPDLLITKMRLYAYCAHFVPVLPDTSNSLVSFRAINLRSDKAFFCPLASGLASKKWHLLRMSACRGHSIFLVC